uniref:Helicase C-terminal domain-containing protein n=1 Tax=Alexandrium catenella TaxID=2925 RepID=A0A7S1Q7F6_ALECA|mmetsp:Transcript_19843/g.53994  ORF Transcript_19843/g.53994 Transcript_19843/m.53994 type:complete len:294 (+) Transcript_19843:2-883(+)
MGFEPQIRKVMDQMPAEERQTAMFTATWPKECKRLAERYIKNPTQVQIGSDDITTNKNIRQHVEICSDDREKKTALKRILGYLVRGGTCLVFCNTKRKCRDLAWEMGNDRDLGLQAVELHGDLDQRQRDDALNRFRAGEAKLCVATDVAARGLDIRNISTVVNFDAPNQQEDYVHRIGRTGRAGEKGISYTFLVRGDPSDIKKARAIAEVMQTAGQEVSEELRQMAGQPVPRSGGKGGFKGGFKGGGKGGVGGKGGKGGFKGGRGMMMKGGPKGDAVLGGGARPGQGGVEGGP